jgi:hypothetical protein
VPPLNLGLHIGAHLHAAAYPAPVNREQENTPVYVGVGHNAPEGLWAATTSAGARARRRPGLQVHVGEERRRLGGAHHVHVRRALRLQPVRVRARGHAVRAAEQEGHLLLRRRL